ncbi:hypothetical protein pdam_00009909, partial [Pocillopora damicornis]
DKSARIKRLQSNKSRRNSSQETVETYFKPKTNVIYARFLFNSAPQNTEEGIDEFDRNRNPRQSYKATTTHRREFGSRLDTQHLQIEGGGD